VPRARQPAGLMVRSAAGFVNRPRFFFLCRSRYSTGDRLEIIGPGMGHRRRSSLICRHSPKRVVRNCQGSWPRATSPAIAILFFDCSWPQRVGDPTEARKARKPACLDRLDGRDQVSYSSLRRLAVFSRRAAHGRS
jgi:hypothetical protein